MFVSLRLSFGEKEAKIYDSVVFFASALKNKEEFFAVAKIKKGSEKIFFRTSASVVEAINNL